MPKYFTPPDKMPKDFHLIDAIRKEKDYKSNNAKRDKYSRKFLNESCSEVPPSKMVTGSLYLMEYFEPKTKEELEYWDAMPCSILFGRFKTKDGEPRILAFNLHYFPPRMRFVIMDRIFEIFKPFYKKQWLNQKSNKDMEYMEYMMIVHQLKKAKLDFGVREYIPSLVGSCLFIPPAHWSKAVLTEGKFKKTTRDNIISYWKAWAINKDLAKRAAARGKRS